jgi:hypothetical protein
MLRSSGGSLQRPPLFGILHWHAMLQVSIEAAAALMAVPHVMQHQLDQHVRFALAPAGKPKGFAFASFMCHADAERAIALVNKQVKMSVRTGQC